MLVFELIAVPFAGGGGKLVVTGGIAGGVTTGGGTSTLVFELMAVPFGCGVVLPPPDGTRGVNPACNEYAASGVGGRNAFAIAPFR